MDPNEALRQVRYWAESLAHYSDAEDARGSADEMAAAFKALDEWLSRGGFPPDAWRTTQRV